MSIRRIDENFHVIGQLTPDQMRDVAAMGYKAIICMRPDNEGFGQPAFADIEKAARAEGMDCFHIPVVPGRMTENQGKELKAVIDKGYGPILAFCASGNRCAAAYQAVTMK